MIFYWGLALGLFLGASVGFFAACLCVVAARADDDTAIPKVDKP